MTTPHTLEQIASLQQQLADCRKALEITHRSADDQMHQKRELQKEIDRLRPQQQSAGGEWTEAAAKEIDELTSRTNENGYQICDYDEGKIAAIIRRHAPQPDLASVREAARRFVENLLLPHSVDANEEHEHKVDRLTEQLMDALRPLLPPKPTL